MEGIVWGKVYLEGDDDLACLQHKEEITALVKVVVCVNNILY